MKQRTVGTYVCGFHYVDIVLRDGDGAEYYALPKKGRPVRIKIGADVSWQDVVRSFLHEALEMCLDYLHDRYTPSQDMGRDHGQYLFVFNHADFSDACGSVAELAVQALPDLATALKQWKKDSK